MNKGIHKPKIWTTKAWPYAAQSLKSKRRKSIWSLALATLLLLISVVMVLAVDGDFELDGNIWPDGKTDWADFFDEGGNSNNPLALFTPDEVTFKNGVDTTTFAGSAKNNDPISSWSVGTANQITPKDELSNVYSYFKFNDNGDLLIYAGLERVDPGGDSHVDIEINQQKITYNTDTGAFCDDCGKTPNDLLLTMDFEKGGSLGSFTIHKWDGTEWIEEDDESLGGEGCNSNDTACAFNNSAEEIEPGSWPTYDDKGKVLEDGDKLHLNAFTEMGVNIHDLLDLQDGDNICFNTIQFHSRSSDSFNSQLKDFAIQNYDLCAEPTMTVTPKQAANRAGTNHTFTVEILKQEFSSGVTGVSDVVVSAVAADSNGAVTAFVDEVTDDELSGNECKTGDDGKCTITITSASPGVSAISFSADAPFNGGTVPLTDSATKTWVDAQLTLSPETATNLIGTDHQITAHLQYNKGDGAGYGNAPDGQTINFAIDSGPGSFKDDLSSCTTSDGTGTCFVTIQSDAAGLSTVSASWYGTINLSEELSVDIGSAESPLAATPVTKRWVSAQLLLTPAEGANFIGDDHILTAQLLLNDGDPESADDNPIGKTITFELITDENDNLGPGSLSSQTCEITEGDSCTVTLTSNAIGVDHIKASWTGSLSGLEVSVEDTAIKHWIDVRLVLSPLAAANQVNNPHDIVGALQFDDGDGSGFRDVESFANPINFYISGQGGFVENSETCDEASCVTINSAATGESQVSADYSGDIDIGNGVMVSVASVSTSEPAVKVWVDARLTLEVITGSDWGTTEDTQIIKATLEFDYGDGQFKPAGEQTISFSIEEGDPGTFVDNDNDCVTIAAPGTEEDGTCTVNILFTGTNGGTVDVMATWMGNIPVEIDGSDPVTVFASASASADTSATFFSVKVGIESGNEIECDSIEGFVDAPNSVNDAWNLSPQLQLLGEFLDPNSTHTDFVENCLISPYDIDVYIIPAQDTSSEINIHLTSFGNANYDFLVLKDAHNPPPGEELATAQLMDATSVIGSGTIGTGTIGTGTIGTGTIGTGTIGTGTIGTGTIGTGTIGTGTIGTGTIGTGTIGTGTIGTGTIGTGTIGTGTIGTAAVSTGTVDEAATTQLEAGQVAFIVVISEESDYGPKYRLTVDWRNTDNGPDCSWSGLSYVPQVPSIVPPFPNPNGGNPSIPKTGYFINVGRFEATYGPSLTSQVLSELQALPGAVVVPIDATTIAGGVTNPSQVSQALADIHTAYFGNGADIVGWNNDYCRIAEANNVAAAIRGLINTDALAALDNIVIVGGVEMIPPRLEMEGAINIAPEDQFFSGAGPLTPAFWWLQGSRVPTYDYYAVGNGDPMYLYLGDPLYVPAKPISVLAETPGNIMDAIGNFVDNSGSVAPSSCLITGYQHLTDAAEEIDQLISLPTDSLISEHWTAANLGNAFNNLDSNSVVSFNAHFSQFAALPAGGHQLYYSTDIPPSLKNVVGTSMGCHSSFNLPDSWLHPDLAAYPEVAQDWPQVLLGNGWATWFGTGSYAYGDDEDVKYTEQLMLYFLDEAAKSDTTVGQAYINAKHRYLNLIAGGNLDIYDIKSLRGAIMYGFPQMAVQYPSNPLDAFLDPFIGPVKETSGLAYPEVDDGVLVTQSEPVALPNSDLTMSSLQVSFTNLDTHDTFRGNYYTEAGADPDQVASYPGRVKQPLFILPQASNVHGAMPTLLEYTDVHNFDMVVPNVATDSTMVEPFLLANGWFPPMNGLLAVNHFPDNGPNLSVVSGQYTTKDRHNPTNKLVERKYDTMEWNVFASDNQSDFWGPAFWAPHSTCDEFGNVTFSALVDDESGVEEVRILYHDVANTRWLSLDGEEFTINDGLTAFDIENPPFDISPFDPTEGDVASADPENGYYPVVVVEGQLPLGPDVEYIWMARDGAGNVSFDSNYNLNFMTCSETPDAINNRAEETTHEFTLNLKANFGSGWVSFPGIARFTGDVFVDQPANVDASPCMFPYFVDGTCTININDPGGEETTSLKLNPDLNIEVLDEEFTPVDEFQVTLNGDDSTSYVKEWWAGSISVFKQVHTNSPGPFKIYFTLSRADHPEFTPITIDRDYPDDVVPGTNNSLLFTWENLPSGDDYQLEEAVPPAPLVGPIIIPGILVNDGNRNALVTTVTNFDAQGCTPGYWKNHLDMWALDPEADFDTTFGTNYFEPDITLLEAVNLGGGGVQRLARHGVAALLSATYDADSNQAIFYYYTETGVISLVQSGDADSLVSANEAGCPLN